MTDSIRVQVTPAATETGWLFTLDCPEGRLHSVREVRAFSEPGWARYPIPRRACGPGCEHRLCAQSPPNAVVDLLDLLDSRADGGGVAGDAIGRYLFDILLSADWTAIVEMSVRLQREVIEVALTWPYYDASGEPDPSTGWPLSQLPWELMRNGSNRCLCPSEHGLSVAVTRVVAGTTAEMRRLPVPPRVLFVVGAHVADPAVRAGAEMLALVREFRRAGCRIQHRILQNAEPWMLSEAMRTFKPEIVHFIGHGDLDQYGRGRIKLKADEGKRDTWMDAGQLLEALGADHSLPSVVVLSACDTAGEVLLGPARTAPLAAELVHGGIPVVVAMAGKISDRAARIFSRYFARELAAGESLVTATAQARRFAFTEGEPDDSDWALPAIFFSAAVEPQQVTRDSDPAAEAINHLMATATLDIGPVFCAREHFLQAFWAMLGDRAGESGRTGWEPQRGNHPSVLVALADSGQAGVGKTRLLQQMAKEALQNGHLPLMIGMDKGPCNVGELAKAMGEAMESLAFTVLGVGEDFGSGLRALFSNDPPPSSQAVAYLADALARDSDELRAEAIREYGSLFSEASRVVVLIDNLDLESEPLLEALFAEFRGVGRGLIDYGFGVSKENPVPVALVVLTDGRKGIRKQLDGGDIKRDWLVTKKLLPFDERGEDMLAYERVLLNPFKSGSGIMQTPWVFNRDLQPDEWLRNVNLTRTILKGLPTSLTNADVFDTYLQAAVRFEMLKRADEDIRSELVQ
ncbi:MAG TPA: CHAT domain-containing protein [Trebonia sp.]